MKQEPIYFAPQPSGRELALLLKSKTIVAPSGCWEWTGGKNGVGYGSVPSRLHKSRYAHRAMFEAVCAKIPSGMYVLHSCDNRVCINPEHLFLGTHLDNIKDMQEKGRHRGGSLANATNPNAKFSDETVALIRLRANSGIPRKVLEKEFNISESQCGRIINGQVRRVRT